MPIALCSSRIATRKESERLVTRSRLFELIIGDRLTRSTRGDVKMFVRFIHQRRRLTVIEVFFYLLWGSQELRRVVACEVEIRRLHGPGLKPVQDSRLGLGAVFDCSRLGVSSRRRHRPSAPNQSNHLQSSPDLTHFRHPARALGERGTSRVVDRVSPASIMQSMECHPCLSY